MSRAEEVRAMRTKGMSIDEICERLGAYERNQRHEVIRVCRKMGKPATDEEKHVSITAGQLHDNDWADDYIKQKTDGKFIRVSDYINMDSKITIRCTECGTDKTTWFSNFRGKKRIRCQKCYEEELEQKRIQREESARRIRLMKAEQKRINKIRGTQIVLRFCIDCNAVLDNERERCRQCQKKLQNKNKDISRRRKIQSSLVDKDITVEKLYKKDKGICYLCGCQCDYEDYIIRDGAFIAGNNYPSIDHVKPLARGGLHSWNNVRLAHRICNTKKCDEWSE